MGPTFAGVTHISCLLLTAGVKGSVSLIPVRGRGQAPPSFTVAGLWVSVELKVAICPTIPTVPPTPPAQWQEPGVKCVHPV